MPGGCAHPLCPIFRRMLPTKGRAQRDIFPFTGGLKGSPALSSQMVAMETSSLGPRGFLQGLEGCQGTEEPEEIQAWLQPSSCLAWPSVVTGMPAMDGGWARPVSVDGPCRTLAPINPCLPVRVLPTPRRLLLQLTHSGRSGLVDQFIEALPRPPNAVHAQDTCLSPHHPRPSHRHPRKGRRVPARTLQTLGREQAPSSPPRGARLLSLVAVSSASTQLSKKPFLSLPVGPPMSHTLGHLTSGA